VMAIKMLSQKQMARTNIAARDLGTNQVRITSQMPTNRVAAVNQTEMVNLAQMANLLQAVSQVQTANQAETESRVAVQTKTVIKTIVNQLNQHNLELNKKECGPKSHTLFFIPYPFSSIRSFRSQLVT